MSDLGVPYVMLQIIDKKCDYCLQCVSACPNEALTYDKCFEHNPNECANCECCKMACENEAIKILNYNGGLIM